MPATCKLKNIVKRDGRVVPYQGRLITDAIQKAVAAASKPNRKLAAALKRQVEQALSETYGSNSMPSVEEIQDVVENILMTSGHTDVARRYIIYRHQRAQAREGRSQMFEVSDNIPYKKIYEVMIWNIDHECGTITDLNRLIQKGGYDDLVHAADQRYENEIDQAVNNLQERLDKVRLVIIAGPSSSGKTTTTIKIKEKLEALGADLVTLNIDNYFFNLVDHPMDDFGDYDYETPQALDLKLINKHVHDLLSGKMVKTPVYNFKTGLRSLDVHPVKLKKKQILVLDSLHGLYGGMTSRVPKDMKFGVYVETLGQLRSEEGQFMRWADIRLLRRMIRDMHHRNTQPMQTLTHWHYVRRSELQHIIPFNASADAVINTALPYELPILKTHLSRYFPSALKKYKEDPHRLDAFIRADRIHHFMKPLKLQRDESMIPSDSLLREFIGGSQYKY